MKQTTHRVIAGDTLYSLAKKYGTTVNELKSINSLTSDLIQVGQILDLTKNTHKVVSGDTLFSLAKKYGLTVNILKSINGLVNDTIKIGQVLKLKDVIELYWSYGKQRIRLVDYFSCCYLDLNLHIITLGYQLNDSIDVIVDYETEQGTKQLFVHAIIDNNGIATVENVFQDVDDIVIFKE